VTGDVDLLRRAIENVLRNAVHHAPEGTRIDISSQGDDNFAIIAVRDWGPGVPDPALGELLRPAIAQRAIARIVGPSARRTASRGCG
jgi:signal transduction histidine kinase